MSIPFRRLAACSTLHRRSCSCWPPYHRHARPAAQAAPDAATQKQLGPHRLRISRRRRVHGHRLRHGAARRQHDPLDAHHQAQQHGRRTRHPSLHRQALLRVRVQLRQRPLHAGLHLRPAPALPFCSGGAQTGVRETHSRLRRASALPPLRHPAVPRSRRRHHQVQAHPVGGQGLPQQYRAAYYYTAGLEDNFPDSHFGMRVGFRQLIYLGAGLPAELPHHHPQRPHLRTDHWLLCPVLDAKASRSAPDQGGRILHRLQAAARSCGQTV